MHHQVDKIRLLDLTRAEHAFVERTLALMDEAEMVQPGAYAGTWSVKDVLAHITAWEQLCIGWVEAGRRGETVERPAPGYTWDDIDRLNADIRLENKDRPLDEVLARFDRSYQQMLGTIEGLSEEELVNPDAFEWIPEDVPLGMFIAYNTYLHYFEHIVEVRQWLAQS